MEETKKLSYEELEKALAQQTEQNKQLMMQFSEKLREINMGNYFKRLDYLLKIIELKDTFSTEFVQSCVSEVESFMTIPDQEENK